MGITFGDYLIDSGYYDPEEEPMPIDVDERMKAAERRGYACQSLEHAKESIVAAALGSCDCNTKSADPIYHLSYCRWLKLLHALDCIDAAVERINPGAGAEPATAEATHGSRGAGRTAGSIPATGATSFPNGERDAP